MPTITPTEDLADGIEPLTAAEKLWIGDMDRLLKRMPERLLIVESGNSLFVVDRAAAAETDLEDGKARRARVVLADFNHGSMKVMGVSG